MTNNISRAFVLAGCSIFTADNGKGTHYTYKVTRKDPDPRQLTLATHGRLRGGYVQSAPVFFLALLTGPNNEADYTYLGLLDQHTGAVRLTKKSRYTDDSTPVQVALWALGRLWQGKLFPDGYALRHEGRCGRCGRTLTVPESIVTGIGPECAKRLAA